MSSDNELNQHIKFVDENGNHLQFDLQSWKWAEGELGINSGGEFLGYDVGPMNIDPDIDVHDDASAMQRDRAYKKIREDAEKYFAQHPDQASKIVVNKYSDYLNMQIQKEIKKRVDTGNATSLEKVYMYEVENPHRKGLFCKEQLLGEMSLDAPLEEVNKAIERDNLSATMRKQGKEYKQSVARGESSIKNRVATMQNVRIEARQRKRGDNPGVEFVRIPQEKDDKTMNDDEVNAVIQHKVDQLGGR